MKVLMNKFKGVVLIIFLSGSVSLLAQTDTLGIKTVQGVYYYSGDTTDSFKIMLHGDVLFRHDYKVMKKMHQIDKSLLDKKENGHFVERYDNGKLKSLTTYVYGIEAGTWVYYDEEGMLRGYYKFDFRKEDIFLDSLIQVKTPVYYVQDKDTLKADTIVRSYYKLPSIMLTYYTNGKLESERYYKDNNPDGIWRVYQIDGNLFSEEEYKNGNLIRKIPVPIPRFMRKPGQ